MKKKRHNLDESVRFVAQHYQKGLFDPTTGWRRLGDSLPEFRRAIHLSLLKRVAAAALLLLITGVGILMMANRPKQLLAQSDNTAFTLPDQTEIVMQEGAALTYDRHFGDQSRNVSMRGDIRFSVAHDKNKPFIVSTPTANITVLGTVFDVSEHDEGTALSVISGKVLFTPESPAVQVLCTSGMRIDYKAKGKEINVYAHDSSILYSAEQNTLTLNNAPLEQVILLLSQFYDVKLDAPAEGLQLRLTTSFSGQGIIEIVNIINFTLDTQIQITN